MDKSARQVAKELLTSIATKPPRIWRCEHVVLSCKTGIYHRCGMYRNQLRSLVAVPSERCE